MRNASVTMRQSSLMIMLLAVLVVSAGAQEVSFPEGAAGDASSVAGVIPELASRLITVYKESDQERYLDNLSRLQIAVGRDSEGLKTMSELRALRSSAHSATVPAVTLPYEIFADAKEREKTQAVPYAVAFESAYRDALVHVDDKTAAVQVPWVFGTHIGRLRYLLQAALDKQKGHSVISVADGVELVRRHLAVEVYAASQPLLPKLHDEDDRRRYFVEANQLVKTPDGASICVLVIRPRKTEKLTALLNFSIYADSNHTDEARRSAANGYAGVAALTRGKGCSPYKPVPIEHDGADADAVIEWISRQPWSDGRVGMFGGSYDGFTQWAAAKHKPEALKAIMPSVTFGPGLGFPMEGNVFMNYAYPWPLYTTDNKELDDATYLDFDRWNRLNHDWYVSGRAYRDLDKIDGTPNPVFDDWLQHPSYDAYWQHAIPYKEEFAQVTLPSLTTTGYYDSGQIDALYYFAQHEKYLPTGEHYFLIGPYDHVGGQRGTISPLGSTSNSLRGYELDPVAQIDIPQLRYAWFDYLFKGAAKPAILADRVNYEVMGANTWKHAHSVSAMSNSRLRFHLNPVHKDGGRYLLSGEESKDSFVTQDVDLADRSEVNSMAPASNYQPTNSAKTFVDEALDTWNIIDKAPHLANSIEFVSEPLTEDTEVSGLFSGEIELAINKKDFDFSVTLFELTPAGEYFHLSYYWTRASYAADRSHRQLLTPGKRTHLPFTSGRLTSKMVKKGSRFAVVLAVIKQPGEQINYGTGKDVSDETIADAGAPLSVKWYSKSFVEIPVRK